DLGTLRQLGPPVPVGVNPSVDALRATFGTAIGRATVARDGETVVGIAAERLHGALQWLRDTPGQQYDYLVDVTAVEYRDRERPLEVVYFLRSLERHADLRVKVELDPAGELATPGVDARGEPTRVPLGVEAPAEPPLAGEHMLINLGPQHPATHGVLRLVVELDGETVVRVIPHVGYLHSGFEKLGEYRHYNQIIPLTDRTDYLSPMANNVGFALAAERLMGIEITPRCKVLRVIACEMSRIISHMVWLGTTSIDLGAFTPFLWAFQERERIYDLQELWTGARLTTSVTRVGGLMADVPDDFVAGLREFTQTFPRTLSEIDRVLTRNGVWVGRTQGVGALTAAEATNHSLSGPMLRASGVPYDVRKDKPYLDYD